MATQYKYDGARNTKSGQCSSSYSQLKNTSKFNCSIACLCPGNLDVRSSFDQMMYKKWISNYEIANKVVNEAVESYRR
jgi:hypothetical protein